MPSLPCLAVHDAVEQPDPALLTDFGSKLDQVLALPTPWAHLEHCQQVMSRQTGPGTSVQPRAAALLAEAAQRAGHACSVVQACRRAVKGLPTEYQWTMRRLRLLWDLVGYRLATIQSLQQEVEADPELARTWVDTLRARLLRSPPAYRPATLSGRFWLQAERLTFPLHEMTMLIRMSAAGKVPALT